MNYQQFLKYREEFLSKNPNIIDCAETNLYKHYEKLKKDWIFSHGHIGKNVHRCHLAEDWLKYHNLTNTLKQNIGVSNGVRHSLEIFIKNNLNKNYLIPQDVYPFYNNLLNENNITYSTYTTINSQLNYDNNDDSDILLVTDPLKPSGRDITPEEIENIKAWLLKNKSKLLIVDCAYSFNIRKEWLQLYESTNQVILLYSLSKLWLLPNCLGISLLPHNDQGIILKEYYKNIERNEEKLNMAFMALNKYTEIPNILKNELCNNIEKTNHILNLNYTVNQDNPSYLFYNQNSFDYWLKLGVLTIPLSIYGSNHNGVIISTLR